MAGIANFGGKKAAPFGKGGKRVTAKKGALRTGAIASGPGKGKFPVNSPGQLASANKLIGHQKGVSNRAVAQHVIAQAKKKGYSVPSSLAAKAK